VFTEGEVDAGRARLGPDPLRHDAAPDRAWAARISRSRAPLATLLMDQSVLAGIGTVYPTFEAGLFAVGRASVAGCYSRYPGQGTGLGVGVRNGFGCRQFLVDRVLLPPNSSVRCGFGKLVFVYYGLMQTLLPHRRARGLGLIL
jgi:hypothetical protein